MGNAPPTSTSRPPDIIQVIGVPRPSLFFALFRSVYYTKRKPKNKKTGEAWERGYITLVHTPNSATWPLLQLGTCANSVNHFLLSLLHTWVQGKACNMATHVHYTIPQMEAYTLEYCITWSHQARPN